MGYFAARRNNRRQVKRIAIDLLQDLCMKFPSAAVKGEALSEAVVHRAAIPLGTYWQNLSAADKTILATGKGCNTRPLGATNYLSIITLRDFIRRGAEHPYRHVKGQVDPLGITCWAGYLKDADAWVSQVLSLNPNTFGDRAGVIHSMNLDSQLTKENAKEQRRSDLYKINPEFPPITNADSMFYAAKIAGNIFESFQAQNKAEIGAISGEKYTINWTDGESKKNLAEARSKWNAKVKEIPEDVRNFVLQVMGYNFDDCYNRWVRWYSLRNVPLDEYIV